MSAIQSVFPINDHPLNSSDHFPVFAEFMIHLPPLSSLSLCKVSSHYPPVTPRNWADTPKKLSMKGIVSLLEIASLQWTSALCFSLQPRVDRWPTVSLIWHPVYFEYLRTFNLNIFIEQDSLGGRQVWKLTTDPAKQPTALGSELGDPGILITPP